MHFNSLPTFFKCWRIDVLLVVACFPCSTIDVNNSSTLETLIRLLKGIRSFVCVAVDRSFNNRDGSRKSRKILLEIYIDLLIRLSLNRVRLDLNTKSEKYACCIDVEGYCKEKIIQSTGNIQNRYRSRILWKCHVLTAS